eukprot:scaffold1766_cov401-Prasinococcus_capsulatus_cf.AAC.41
MINETVAAYVLAAMAPVPTPGPGDDSLADAACDSPASHRNDQYGVDACTFVQSVDECSDVQNYFNYLELYYCKGLSKSFVVCILAIWLVVLLMLLASTADDYFVPPLERLSRRLRLSPEVAGVTLLAFGNGAPDVFGAVAGIDNEDDFEVTLGALLGASVFISTVVLGSVILGSRPRARVDKGAFLRDVLAYCVVTAAILGMTARGKIYVYESISLLVIYVAYVSAVVLQSKIVKKRKDNMPEEAVSLLAERADEIPDESLRLLPAVVANGANKLSQPLLTTHADGDRMPSLRLDELEDSITWHSEAPIPGLSFDFEFLRRKKMGGLLDETPKRSCLQLAAKHAAKVLVGIWGIVYLLLQYPFSILRWLSTPAPDGRWGPRRWVGPL